MINDVEMEVKDEETEMAQGDGFTQQGDSDARVPPRHRAMLFMTLFIVFFSSHIY